MTSFDIAIVVILAASVLIGLYRGFVREVLSLATLVLALFVAVRFSDLPEVWLPDIETENFVLTGADLQAGLMFALLFISVLAVGRFVRNAIAAAMQGGLKGLFDRVLGAGFGAARGGVIVLALVLLAGLTQLPFADRWRASALIPPFEQAARYAMCHVPPSYQSPHYVCASAQPAGL